MIYLNPGPIIAVLSGLVLSTIIMAILLFFKWKKDKIPIKKIIKIELIYLIIVFLMIVNDSEAIIVFGPFILLIIAFFIWLGDWIKNRLLKISLSIIGAFLLFIVSGNLGIFLFPLF